MGLPDPTQLRDTKCSLSKIPTLETRAFLSSTGPAVGSVLGRWRFLLGRNNSRQPRNRTGSTRDMSGSRYQGSSLVRGPCHLATWVPAALLAVTTASSHFRNIRIFLVAFCSFLRRNS